MAAPKRSNIQREKDLETIADMYLRGESQQKIAAHIGVSRQQVSYDLSDIRRRWQERMLQKIDVHKSEELAKLDRIENECWLAWEKSKRDAVIEKQESTSDGDRKKSRTRHGRDGDSRFIEKIQWCINKRCEILGINAPRKIQVNDDEYEWTDVEIRKTAEKIIRSRKLQLSRN